MALAIAIAVVALLLIGFLLLTSLEARRGARVLPAAREALDGAAVRVRATLGSGRIMTLAVHNASLAIRHAAHEIAHIVLAGIRMLERTLTRTVRALRESIAHHRERAQKEKPAPTESTAEVE